MHKPTALEWLFCILTIIFGGVTILLLAWYRNGELGGVFFQLTFYSLLLTFLAGVANRQGGDTYSQESNGRTDVRPETTAERRQND